MILLGLEEDAASKERIEKIIGVKEGLGHEEKL